MSETTTRRGGGVALARWSLVLLAGLFTLGALTQFFLVGLSMFEDGARWQDHKSFGSVLGLLTYMIWIPAVLGRAGRGVIFASLMLYILFMAQYAFINVDSGAVKALHPLNGTFLLLLGAWLTQRAFALARSPVEVSAKGRERRVSGNYQVGKETA
jgi:hypothetical protein